MIWLNLPVFFTELRNRKDILCFDLTLAAVSFTAIYPLPKNLGTRQQSGGRTVTWGMPWSSWASSTRATEYYRWGKRAVWHLVEVGWNAKEKMRLYENINHSDALFELLKHKEEKKTLSTKPPFISLFTIIFSFPSGKLCSCPGSWGTRWWRLRPATAWETPTLFCRSMRRP